MQCPLVYSLHTFWQDNVFRYIGFSKKLGIRKFRYHLILKGIRFKKILIRHLIVYCVGWKMNSHKRSLQDVNNTGLMNSEAHQTYCLLYLYA